MCRGVHNEQSKPVLFFESIHLSICSTLRCWWAESQEATIEYLIHHIQSLLDLKFAHRKTSIKEGQ